MKHVIEVLRLKYAAQLSHAQISRACGLSKGAVNKYVNLARAQGITWPLPADMDEAALEARLFPAKAPSSRFVVPDGFQIHQELKRKGVTLQLLWAEYCAAHGERAYAYTQFCHHYRQWRERQKRSLRQHHQAGEKVFIDYCGPTVDIVDRHTGEVRTAQIFVGVLGASSYTYVEATWTQSLPDWIASHQRMLGFFGGVPALLVPDNLKAAVQRAERYAPQLNATYAEMAAHYGTAVLPARPYKPKDKAKVEVAVQVVERWILARLRHHRFFSLAELNRAIAALLPELNERLFQGRTESRRDLFESLDRPALRPLPGEAYVYAEWRRARPGIDYHVEVDKRCYSVPHALVGQVLDLRITATTIEVLHRGQRVALHPRHHGPGRYVTVTEHMPKTHQVHRDWSPKRFLRWASQIGPSTAEVVRRQLTDRPHPEHGYRACLGLLSLARRYRPARLEAACARALAIDSARYQSVKSILARGLDQQPLDQSPAQEALPLHANVRGANYYH
ncbi:transposase [Acidihalobacter aeolianus]|uniref:Transposase n=1 Tax=Acidihalobacter aeolianus TaxID=2792603 RepID=A0A1D8K9S1_9GAMM|nr:IS21 family transposase [Acidihalobacter aeolianus]AOV15727.1 transposase [Acidihalobacter aeolianus]AOV16635.1 transposase [Acidihalobacter aeolianus]AOV17081.1 transposase [Acidihalobacter aeolianus]AOV17097.1 transposase [Acidihalobacter aeolianus]AOV17178.1 transposase [Acidihalobacter aeolianus]